MIWKLIPRGVKNPRKALYFTLYMILRELPDTFAYTRGTVYSKINNQKCKNLSIGKKSINCINIKIGDNVTIGSDCGFEPNIEIGNNVKIGCEVQIITNSCINRNMKNLVKIEDNVIVGRRAMIMPFVKIGHDTIIGAGAVIPRNIPPYSLAIGNPCQIIKDKYKTKKPGKQNHNGAYKNEK